MPSEHHTRFTVGLDAFANHGPAPVTVTGVDWQVETGLKVLEISYIQRGPGDIFATYGALYGSPPNDLATDRPTYTNAWARREPLLGATLPESNANANFFIVMIGFSGTEGSAGPLKISYTDADGNDGVLKAVVRVRIAPHC